MSVNLAWDVQRGVSQVLRVLSLMTEGRSNFAGLPFRRPSVRGRSPKSSGPTLELTTSPRRTAMTPKLRTIGHSQCCQPPAHRVREELRAEDLLEGDPLLAADGLRGLLRERAGLVGAVEKLIAIEVPERAQWIRTLFAELNRIHSHLIYLGTSGVEMGAMSVFFYCLRERDAVLDLFEMATGVRMHDRYPQVGGVAEDLPKGFYAECRKFCEMMPKRIDEYLDLLAGNPVWK